MDLFYTAIEAALGGDPLLSIHEICALTKRSEPLVYTWFSKGLEPAETNAKTLRVRLSELHRFLGKGTPALGCCTACKGTVCSGCQMAVVHCKCEGM